MKIALVSRQKLGFALSSIPKSAEGTKDRDAWENCNGLVMSWLFNAAEPEIVTTLFYIDSAVIAWKDLEERYKIANKPQIFQMKSLVLCPKVRILSVVTFKN